MKQIAWLLLFTVLLSSCATSKKAGTPKPVRLTSPDMLDGTYFTRVHYVPADTIEGWRWENNIDLCTRLRIKGTSEFVAIKSVSPQQLKIIYYADGEQKDTILEGKWKKKYFEVNFRKKRMIIIPVLFSTISIDRIRIGKTETGELYLNTNQHQSGNLLFMAGGGGTKRKFAFPDSTTLTGLVPSVKNGMWGYAENGKFIISPMYNYASVFEGEVARVKKGNKWGIINKNGIAITEFKYDSMEPFNTIYNVSRVTARGKHGVINMQGEEVIPVIYDGMFDYFKYGMTRVNLGGKRGLVSHTGILSPAIYDDISDYGKIDFIWDDYKPDSVIGAWVKLDKVEYLVTSDGLQYETIRKSGRFNIKHTYVVRESKKKVEFNLP